MKLAIIYDRINKFGGAEQVLLALHKLWPQAPLYTAVFHPKSAPWARSFQIKPSFLQFFPLAKTHHELYPMITPLAFESFDFSKFDVVISVTSAEAKAIITKPNTLHLCYCLTPTRYLWSHEQRYLKSPGLGIFNRLGKFVFKHSRSYLKKLDLIASHRPDIYLAISKTVQRRIRKYYHRHSDVIYPPVDTARFSKKLSRPSNLTSKNYFLLVSRLTPYKNVDLAIKAFNQLKSQLVIVGSGREAKNLKTLKSSNITFLGSVKPDQLVSLYQHCQALIMPQEEDFGLVSLEAQAAGKPVIALNQGGGTETIIPNKTGILFSLPTVDSLTKAVKQSISYSWEPESIKHAAKKFDQKTFLTSFKNYVETQWQNHQKSFQ